MLNTKWLINSEEAPNSDGVRENRKEETDRNDYHKVKNYLENVGTVRERERSKMFYQASNPG